MKYLIIFILSIFSLQYSSLKGQQINWSFPLQDKEIDILEPYDGESFLLGTYDLEGYTWGPGKGHLYLVNVGTGDTIWSYIRIQPSGFKILSASEKIICYDSIPTGHQFFALSPSSGRQIWSLKREGRLEYYQVDNNLKLLELSKDKIIVERLSLEDGKCQQLFEFTYTDEDEKALCYRMVADGLLIFYKDYLKKLSDNGQMVWTIKYPVRGAVSNPIVQEMADKLLIILSETAYYIDSSTGQIKKTLYGGTTEEVKDKYEGINNALNQSYEQSAKKIKFTFENMLMGNKSFSHKEQNDKELFYNLRSKLINDYAIEGIVFTKDQAVILSKINQNSLISVQGKDQKLLIKETIKSNLYFDSTFIYFTSENYFYKLNYETYEIIKVGLPKNFFRDKAYFDMVLVNEEQVLIYNDVSICAYSLSMEPKYSMYIDGSLPFTVPYYKHLLSFFNFSNVTSIDYIAGLQSSNTSLNNYYADQFRLKDNYYKQQYRTLASPQERLTNIAIRESNLNRAQQAEQSQAMSDLVYSMIGALSQLDATFTEWETSDKISSTIMCMNYTQLLNNICLQGNYFIRPFIKNGWFLAVIDVNTGQRTNIYLGAYNKYLQINSINTFPFLYDLKRNNLIVKYFPPKGETYTQAATGDMFYWWRFPPKRELPKPLLVSINMNEMEFSSENEDSIAQPVPIADMEIIESIIKGDLNKVKSLLNEGSNPNAIDRFGISALMYATLKIDVKMYKLLESSGANVLYTDYSNLSLYNYMKFYKCIDPTIFSNIMKTMKKSSFTEKSNR